MLPLAGVLGCLGYHAFSSLGCADGFVSSYVALRGETLKAHCAG